jgi:hypothetical protein
MAYTGIGVAAGEAVELRSFHDYGIIALFKKNH